MKDMTRDNFHSHMQTSVNIFSFIIYLIHFSRTEVNLWIDKEDTNPLFFKFCFIHFFLVQTSHNLKAWFSGLGYLCSRGKTNMRKPKWFLLYVSAFIWKICIYNIKVKQTFSISDFFNYIKKTLKQKYLHFIHTIIYHLKKQFL